eukprot:42572_1
MLRQSQNLLACRLKGFRVIAVAHSGLRAQCSTKARSSFGLWKRRLVGITQWTGASPSSARKETLDLRGGGRLSSPIHFVSYDNAISSTAYGTKKQQEYVRHPCTSRFILPRAAVRRKLQSILWHVLPSGYPESVHFSYTHFCLCQFIGMTSSAAAGVISTQALLYAVGLGSAAAPAAAALNWVIKDGLGQLGCVVFSSFVSSRFDATPKVWRMVSAVALDLSTAVELLSPLAPMYFLVIASIANVGKNISFLAASASRAAIHSSFARNENLADVTAKSGAQTVLASMLGTGMGIGLSHIFGSEWADMAPYAMVLCGIHLAFTYWSLKPVATLTLDRQRLDIVVQAHIDGLGVLSPDDVAKKETMLSYYINDHLNRGGQRPSVIFGAPFQSAIASFQEVEQIAAASFSNSATVKTIPAYNETPPYIICIRVLDNYHTRSAIVLLLLSEACTADEALAGAYVALFTRHHLEKSGFRGYWYTTMEGLSAGAPGRLLSKEESTSIFHKVGIAAEDCAWDFVKQAKLAGWHTSVNFFEAFPRTRMQFDFESAGSQHGSSSLKD